MLEGEIIKFHRNKAGLTQEQLGKGICSSKHVGKIERGKTSYSSELILLFSERLQIDIQKEITDFKKIEKKLHSWHNSIIKQSMIEVEKTKKELEKNLFINSSKYAPLYQLLEARYYILKKDFEKTYAILQHIQRDYPNLPPYEKNLLRHVWGLYYVNNYRTSNTENHQKAINILKEIDKDEYGNFEYYYHLAVAYQWIDSKVMAYAYAEKALRYFKETNNFLRTIDAESMMLLQIGSDIHLDVQELIEPYHNLIHDCEILNALDRKEMLLTQLGYQYFKRKDYANAQKFFKEALDMVDTPSFLYLQRMHNYLRSSLEGKLLPKRTMLKVAQQGMSLAKELDDRLYQTLFKLLIYRIEDQLDMYYNFIEKDALPYFQSNKHTIMVTSYAKQLYNHYMEIEQYEKAARISKVFIDFVE